MSTGRARVLEHIQKCLFSLRVLKNQKVFDSARKCFSILHFRHKTSRVHKRAFLKSKKGELSGIGRNAKKKL